MAADRRVAAGAAVLVCALALDSGGYFPRSWVWCSVVCFWAAALALGTAPAIRVGRAGAAFAGSMALLTGWTLLSAVWSVEPAQSVLDARRDLVYVAVALGVVAAAPRRFAAALGPAVLAAVDVVAVVGIARYAVSGPVDRAEAPFLSWPVGYANAFAALCVIAFPVALALAAHDPRGFVRGAGAASVPIFVAVVVLASSRGGVVAAFVALLALVMLDRRRRSLAGAIGRVAAPVVAVCAVCAWADLGAHAADPGRRSAVAAVLAVAAAAAGLLAARPVREPEPGRELPRGLAVAGVLCLLSAAAVVTALPERSATHLVAAQRAAYWAVGRSIVSAHPLLGGGAGTFGRFWLDARPTAPAGALDAHNLYLETLAELGPLGVLLLLAFLGIPLACARVAARTTPLGAAAAAAYIGFLVHALVDWDWEMPAVTVSALAVGASLLVPARPETRPLGGGLRLAAAALAVMLAVLALLGLASGAVPAAAAPPGAAAAVRPVYGLP
jgi:O-antigen ligase/polysaccharide polymerase Wzy-like membrane protein